MLSFATEFPIKSATGIAQFIDSARSWLLGSPHTKFTLEELDVILQNGRWSTEKGNERIEALIASSGEEGRAAIKYTRIDDDLQWDTAVVFSGKEPDAWVGVRTFCESTRATVRLPSAKKPIIVRSLLKNLGGGIDGKLLTQDSPHFLKNSEIDFAVDLITGRAENHLPIVYISSRFDGTYCINSELMSQKLAGMAHVVVEPNRPFSRRLQIEVASENVYGGTVGVYWPNGSGRRSFFLGVEHPTAAALERAITEEIRTALLNRRPLVRCAWSSVQEALSHSTYEALKNAGSVEVDKYTEAFDAEIKAKNEKLHDAEREITRLQAELRRYESKISERGSLSLKVGEEQDLYPDELLDIALDAIAESINRVQSDGRRQHVLSAIARSNSSAGESALRKARLKDLLREYRSMDAKTRAGLKELGFEIEDEGKHYKLIYQGDDRYVFPLSKSGSDYRGGLNSASDIAKRIF